MDDLVLAALKTLDSLELGHGKGSSRGECTAGLWARYSITQLFQQTTLVTR